MRMRQVMMRNVLLESHPGKCGMGIDGMTPSPSQLNQCATLVTTLADGPPLARVALVKSGAAVQIPAQAVQWDLKMLTATVARRQRRRPQRPPDIQVMANCLYLAPSTYLLAAKTVQFIQLRIGSRPTWHALTVTLRVMVGLRDLHSKHGSMSAKTI